MEYEGMDRYESTDDVLVVMDDGSIKKQQIYEDYTDGRNCRYIIQYAGSTEDDISIRNICLSRGISIDSSYIPTMASIHTSRGAISYNFIPAFGKETSKIIVNLRGENQDKVVTSPYIASIRELENRKIQLMLPLDTRPFEFNYPKIEMTTKQKADFLAEEFLSLFDLPYTFILKYPDEKFIKVKERLLRSGVEPEHIDEYLNTFKDIIKRRYSYLIALSNLDIEDVRKAIDFLNESGTINHVINMHFNLNLAKSIYEEDSINDLDHLLTLLATDNIHEVIISNLNSIPKEYFTGEIGDRGISYIKLIGSEKDWDQFDISNDKIFIPWENMPVIRRNDGTRYEFEKKGDVVNIKYYKNRVIQHIISLTLSENFPEAMENAFDLLHNYEDIPTNHLQIGIRYPLREI